MTVEPSPRRPKVPTTFNLVDQHDEDFERMCFELIRLEFRGVVKPSNTNDGGADAGLPRKGGGYDRCWQSKHSKGAIPWDNWKKSFDDARRNWGMREYTFCFPRDFTDTERKTFDKHFHQADAEVKVNYWNGAELIARLTDSEEGRRVARTFFDHSDLDQDRVLRTVETGGQLDTGENALERMMPVGGFLQTHDTYFSYPASTYESEQPGTSPPPGTVMSYEQIKGGVAARVDIVPRSEEALEHYGPQFQLQPTDDEEGKKAWPKLQAALAEGRSIELGSGVDVTFTKLPPAFKEMEGKRLSGATLTLTAEKGAPPPFDARLKVEGDRGKATWDVVLEPREAPEGWEHALVGKAGGMEAALLFREVGGRGETRWNFNYRPTDDLRAAEQLAALRVLSALSGTGTVTLIDRGKTNRPTIMSPTPSGSFSEEAEAILAFLEDIVTIEEWAEVTLPVSFDATAAQIRAVALIAEGLRNKGWEAAWHDMTFNLAGDAASRLRTGRSIRVDQGLWAKVLGQKIELGHVRQRINGYDIAQMDKRPDGRYEIRLEPLDADAAKFFQEVRKGPVGKKPPPPPQRKGNRKKKGGKRKGGRGRG